jgi:CRISPR-associated protein Csd1
MILQALRQLALSENLVGDPDFEHKPVSWRVNLHEDGTLSMIEDLRRNANEGKKGKPKWVGLQIEVPLQFYRSGTAPPSYFLVDNAKFVFGKTTGNTEFDPQQGREFCERFRSLVAACADATKDPDLQAVLRFFDLYPPGSEHLHLPEDAVGNDLFAFRVATGGFAHLRPAVRQWWKQQRQGQLVAGDAYQCLVTGVRFGEIEQFPQVANVPGAAKPIKLISFNQSAFESFGLKRNENAAVSRQAGEEAAAALNRLLQPEPRDGSGKVLGKRHLRLPANTAVCFWTARAGAEAGDFLDDLPDLLEGENEGTVREAYRSIWQGGKVDLKDPAAFYALTLSGAQGRAIVRDWFETSLAEVTRNLAQHFRDLAIVRHAKAKDDDRRSLRVPLRWLMESLAAEGRSAPVPGSLEGAFIRSAFVGIPYPFQLLQRALTRARVEAGRDEWTDRARRDARAALLKAVLNRRRRFDPQTAARYQEVTPEMNPNYESPGYALGLLMAVLERLQSAAMGDVNASLVDRYFSAASATPRAIFVRLLKNAKHHARKARDGDNTMDRVTAFRCERLIDAVVSRFDLDTKHYPPRADGLPPHLDLEQQGLFVLGYHQMRYWLWMNNEERGTWEGEHPAAPRAFQWLKQPLDEPAEPQPAVS